eukprot:TRINITY_DN5265_c0_g1_i2.p1 TRINITY_DN5265_c0_g1~~TRINITY_DN5265_c0_g1_i2.p1  ORF type:complete len:1520 (+),score=363.72 TRINITY_DN5265_c0_g1_i2:326-4885(+)
MQKSNENLQKSVQGETKEISQSKIRNSIHPGASLKNSKLAPITQRVRTLLPSEVWNERQVLEFLEVNHLRQYKPIFFPKQASLLKFSSGLLIEQMFELSTGHLNVIELVKSTPEYLLEFLTLPETSPVRSFWHYYRFLFHFFLVYPSFVSPLDVLNKLIEKWHSVPNVDFDGYSYSVRSTIVNILREWLLFARQCGADDFKSEEVSDVLIGFLSEINKVNVEFKSEFNQLLMIYQTSDEPPVFDNQPDTRMDSIQKIETISQVDPEEIARQITLLDSFYFKKIKREEWLCGNWYKSDKTTLAPGIVDITHHNNRMALWVTTEILKFGDHDARSKMISRFICVLHHLHLMSNFNGMIHILSSLHSSTVQKLKSTWASVSKSERDNFERLTNVMSNEKHYASYRSQLAKLEPNDPVVPLISLTCQDLFMLNDTMEDEIEGYSGWINWSKLDLYASIMSEAVRFNGNHFTFKSVPEIQKLITESDVWSDPDICYEIAVLRDSSVNSTVGTASSAPPVVPITKSEVKYHTVAEDLWSSDLMMTETDWLHFISGANVSKYEQGQHIIIQNNNNTKFYRVKSGTIQFYDGNTQSLPLNNLPVFGPGTFFGEISIMTKSKTTVSVYCTSSVEVYEIEPHIAEEVCIRKPNIGWKWYLFIAQKVASHIISANIKLKNSNKGQSGASSPDNLSTSSSSMSLIDPIIVTSPTPVQSKEDGIGTLSSPPSQQMLNEYEASTETSDRSDISETLSEEALIGFRDSKQKRSASYKIKASRKHTRKGSTDTIDAGEDDETEKRSDNESSSSNNQKKLRRTKRGHIRSPIHHFPIQLQSASSPSDSGEESSSSRHDSQDETFLKSAVKRLSSKKTPNRYSHHNSLASASSPNFHRKRSSSDITIAKKSVLTFYFTLHDKKTIFITDPDRLLSQELDRISRLRGMELNPSDTLLYDAYGSLVNSSTPLNNLSIRDVYLFNPLRTESSPGARRLLIKDKKSSPARQRSHVRGNSSNRGSINFIENLLSLSGDFSPPTTRKQSPGRSRGDITSRMLIKTPPRERKKVSTSSSTNDQTRLIRSSSDSDLSQKANRDGSPLASPNETTTDPPVPDALEQSTASKQRSRREASRSLSHKPSGARLTKRTKSNNVTANSSPVISSNLTSSRASTTLPSSPPSDQRPQDVSLNDKFLQLFNLPGEFVIEGYSCHIRRYGSQRNTKALCDLFITNEHVSFATRGGMISVKIKESVKFEHIDSINLDFKHDTISIAVTQNGNTSMLLFGGFQNSSQVVKLLQRLWKQKNPEKANTNSMIAPGQSNTNRSWVRKSISVDKEDWRLILKGGRTVQYSKGEVILSKGEKTRQIFQLAKGKCRFDVVGLRKEFTYLTPERGGIFGEISFVTHGTTTAQIIAEEDCTVHIIEGYYLNILFQHFPRLAIKFYKHLAQLIAWRVTVMNLPDLSVCDPDDEVDAAFSSLPSTPVKELSPPSSPPRERSVSPQRVLELKEAIKNRSPGEHVFIKKQSMMFVEIIQEISGDAQE